MALSPWPLTFQTTSRNGKGWQDHKGHLLFKQLLELAKDGRIPKHLANCQVPKCPACLFGKITKKPWRTKGKDHRRIRKEDENTPGANTSVNQMESTMQSTGKLLQAKNNGTMIFIDHFSSFTYLHLMTSLSSEQTMAAKATYEPIAQTYGLSIHGYWADNGWFADKEWKQDCNEQHQDLTICGVSTHHQNGIAEKRIHDLCEGARTSLLHAMQCWVDVVSSNLWPFALMNECKIANRVKQKGGSSAEAKFAKVKQWVDLETYHLFGCPVFVLDASLQGGIGKIPRWDPHARVSIYLGHSTQHAGNVALILNIMTGHVSPQYHLVFDDDFATVESMKQGVVPMNWDTLVQTQQELAMPEQYILSPEWERQTANAYPHKRSTPTMLSWPSDTDAAGDNENMDVQAAGMLNDATERDTAAN